MRPFLIQESLAYFFDVKSYFNCKFKTMTKLHLQAVVDQKKRVDREVFALSIALNKRFFKAKGRHVGIKEHHRCTTHAKDTTFAVANAPISTELDARHYT